VDRGAYANGNGRVLLFHGGRRRFGLSLLGLWTCRHVSLPLSKIDCSHTEYTAYTPTSQEVSEAQAVGARTTALCCSMGGIVFGGSAFVAATPIPKRRSAVASAKMTGIQFLKTR